MVFSSYVFIFAFLPVVLSVYYALSRLAEYVISYELTLENIYRT